MTALIIHSKHLDFIWMNTTWNNILTPPHTPALVMTRKQTTLISKQCSILSLAPSIPVSLILLVFRALFISGSFPTCLNRRQRVMIHDIESDPINLNFDVSHDSVSGPVLLSLYYNPSLM